MVGWLSPPPPAPLFLGGPFAHNWELYLNNTTSVFQSQGFLFSLLAVTVYPRLPQCMVLSPSQRQEGHKASGTKLRFFATGDPRKEIMWYFKFGTVMTWAHRAIFCQLLTENAISGKACSKCLLKYSLTPLDSPQVLTLKTNPWLFRYLPIPLPYRGP